MPAHDRPLLRAGLYRRESLRLAALSVATLPTGSRTVQAVAPGGREALTTEADSISSCQESLGPGVLRPIAQGAARRYPGNDHAPLWSKTDRCDVFYISLDHSRRQPAAYPVLRVRPG
jgi:hypothetical protein